MNRKGFIVKALSLLIVGLYTIAGIIMHIKALTYNFVITDAIASIIWYFMLANRRLGK